MLIFGKRKLKLTPWYHEGSANGIKSPYGSCGEPVAAGVKSEGAAAGVGSAFFSGTDAGAGASTFLVSNEPICSWALYFFKMPSLWYFQNCFEASFPATRWRTRMCQYGGGGYSRIKHTLFST